MDIINWFFKYDLRDFLELYILFDFDCVHTLASSHADFAPHGWIIKTSQRSYLQSSAKEKETPAKFCGGENHFCMSCEEDDQWSDTYSSSRIQSILTAFLCFDLLQILVHCQL